MTHPMWTAEWCLTKNAPVGSFIDVRVTGAQVYDLVAEPVWGSSRQSDGNGGGSLQRVCARQ